MHLLWLSTPSAVAANEMKGIDLRGALSGISGSVSIACWIFLLVPQMYETYKKQNADGLSLSFLVIWMLGDVTNLAGAIWGKLLATVIILAAYFCVADTVMIAQILWYNHLSNENVPEEEAHDRQPLLSRRTSSLRRRSSRRDSSTLILAEVKSRRAAVLQNISGLVFIILAGFFGWLVSLKTAPYEPVPPIPEIEVGPQVLGYASALCYLGARIPQIFRNYERKSTEGLSLLFFLFSLLGNISYALSIIFHSSDRDYMVKNVPWLIGSLGTTFQDILIFFQFYIYDKHNDQAVDDA